MPCLSKIFERVLFNQLYEYFERNNILTKRQYRFRKNHSTEFAAIELIHRVTNLLELGNTPFNFHIDLSKAFDVLNHESWNFTVVNSQKNYKNYLSNRSQFYQYCDVSSGVGFSSDAALRFAGRRIFEVRKSYDNEVVF